jgi:hypothetical protein
MASSVVVCLKNPEVVAEAKRVFKEEIADTDYRSLLPADQKPPVELNRVTMEKWRGEQAKHYVKETPEFVL